MALRAQHVEVIGRSGGLAHPHVVLSAQLKVALDAAGRVVRALTFEAVREHEHQRGALAPLLLGGGNELVNDSLSAVGEVTSPKFPHHEGVGRSTEYPYSKAITEYSDSDES